MRILLFKGRGLISFLIRLQSRGVYSHAAVELDTGEIVEAWQGSGVRLLKRLKHGRSDVDTFTVRNLTTEHAMGVTSFLTSQIGKPYDYIGVLRFVTRRRKGGPRKWFCSELVFAAFKAVGISLLERTEAWEVSPQLLSRSTLLVQDTT